jgi:cyanophycin synthetase
MKIIDTRVFQGRNIYSHRKCIKLVVDLEGFGETPSKDIEGFNERLVNILPELKEHRCGIDEEGGFVIRLKEGTYLGHICEHAIIAIEDKLGLNVRYGKTRQIEGDRYYIIYEYEYENAGLECGRTGVELINAIVSGKEFSLEKKMEEVKEKLTAEKLGPSTLSLLNEAKKRGIPSIRIGEGSLFQLGYGKASKLIEATVGGNTPAIAVDIACDKLLTKEVLDSQCIPVAEGGKVRNPIELLFEAEEIGYPVVLKPRFGNQGKGVIVNIKSETELMDAYKILSKDYNDIIIEKYIKGRDYRVCVVGNKVVAVAERIPPYVVGDGVSTIRELINNINMDERRGEGHEKPLTRIKLDASVISYIEKQKFSLDSVPKDGFKVSLRENANLSTGGIAVDCTDMICRENIETCVECAKTIGLDICGIDVCCSDIGKPIDGAIIEVNAAPGIRMHHYPSFGESRNVAEAIINMMFPEGFKNIPLVSVTGTNGKTTTTRIIGHALMLSGLNVGMTTTGGIYINDKCMQTGDTTGYYSALTILTNKNVDAAVLECARGGLIRKGLAYDLADVGVITNITEDHLGLNGINTIEDLAYVKSLVGEAVKPEGYSVINGDDPVSSTIVDRMKGKVIVFSKHKDNRLMRKNIENGGSGVYANDGVLYSETEGNIFPIIKVEDISITYNGVLEYNVENALAATAALIGLGMDYALIRKGLSTFYGDEEHNPGRFNMYDVNGTSVVLDYGHNIEGYKAVLNGAKKMSHKRLIGVIGVPGDRTDTSVMELGRIAGNNFDYIFIKEDQDRRGRKPGEIAELLKKGAVQSGFNKENIKVVLDEKEAFSQAIESSYPGDMVIIFFEKYEPLVKIVREKTKINTIDNSNLAMV